jgi:hypothetical protein
MGLRVDTDQFNGMACLRTHLEPALGRQKFQHQAHDHVLRDEERQRSAFAAACFYDLDNPRRAGLVSHAREWPYLGAVVPGYPTLQPLTEGFWEKFWRLYARANSPDAGHLKRGGALPVPRSSRREEARTQGRLPRRMTQPKTSQSLVTSAATTAPVAADVRRLKLAP